MRLSGSVCCASIFAVSALVLAACSPIPYSVAAPIAVQRQLERELGEPAPGLSEQEKPSPNRAISLCYSRTFNTPEEVLSEAKLMCGTGQVKLVGTDIFWTPCSLQQPARATFICTPEQRAGEAPSVQ